MTHIKSNRYVVLTLLMTIVVVLLILLAGYVKPSGEEIIIREFLGSGVVFDRLTLNGWTAVEDIDSGDPEAYFEERLRTLFPSNVYSRTSNRTTNSTTFTAKGRITPDIHATVTLETSGTGEAAQKRGYLILSLQTPRSIGIYDQVNDILHKFLGPTNHKSVVVSGTINGIISPRDRDTLLGHIIKALWVQNVEKMEDESLVSITGYTPSVHNVLTVAGKSVNINIALRNNSLQKKTMVYIGSPVITSEY